MEILQPPGWPRPRGYANGIAARGRFVFVSGMVGWNDAGRFESDDFAAQARQALLNVVAVLREPETATLLENLGFAIAASTPEAVDQTVRDDIATYRRVIATADVKLQ